MTMLKRRLGRAAFGVLRAVGMRIEMLMRLRMITVLAMERRELRKWAGLVVREWDFWKEREAAKIMPASV